MKITTLKSSLYSSIARFSPKRLSKTFSKDESGIAAIEFAIIAPIMIGMYFGLAEMASAISVDRRISHGTNVAGDLATQMPDLAGSEIEEVLSAALRVMDIPNVNQVSIDMESFILPGPGQPPESRGRIRLNSTVGNFTAFQAKDLDAKLLNENSGVVVTRVKYNYTPVQFSFLAGSIKLEETFLLKPRRSDAVQIHNGEGSLIDCDATHFSDVLCSVTASP